MANHQRGAEMPLGPGMGATQGWERYHIRGTQREGLQV